jgi:hypothetical protein
MDLDLISGCISEGRNRRGKRIGFGSFSQTRRRAAHQYIKKKERGVKALGDTVRGLYHALT